MRCSKPFQNVHVLQKVFPKVFPKLWPRRRKGARGWAARFGLGLSRALMTNLMTKCQVGGNTYPNPQLAPRLSQIRQRRPRAISGH